MHSDGQERSEVSRVGEPFTNANRGRRRRVSMDALTTCRMPLANFKKDHGGVRSEESDADGEGGAQGPLALPGVAMGTERNPGSGKR